MEPEEMDVVELLVDVPVEPAWIVDPKHPLATLHTGQRGMIVHRQDQTPPLYDVEFLDGASGEPCVLAALRSEQFHVVERDTLGDA